MDPLPNRVAEREKTNRNVTNNHNSTRGGRNVRRGAGGTNYAAAVDRSSGKAAPVGGRGRSSSSQTSSSTNHRQLHNQNSTKQSIEQLEPPPGFTTADKHRHVASSVRNRRESMTNPYICVICCNHSSYFAIGACSHPVCMTCGIRIRVVGNKRQCSHCRAELDQMYIVPYTGSWNNWQPPIDCCRTTTGDKFGTLFCDQSTADQFEQLLSYSCTMCSSRPKFDNFQLLRQHMKRTHSLFYCDLCVEHLQLFTFERKLYNMKELATHRRVGDDDDRSHKGHPECRYCLERFLDDDHLYRHMRRDHYYCQLCDADGADNVFYSDYDQLKAHYKAYHFVCENDQCMREQHGIVFRSEIDLKAHKMKEHKAGRQTIDIDFNYATNTDRLTNTDHHRTRGGGNSRRPQSSNVALIDSNNHDDELSARARDDNSNIDRNQPQFDIKKADFPSLLHHDDNIAPMAAAAAGTAQVYGRHVPYSGIAKDEFPSLRTAMRTTQNLPRSTQQSQQQQQPIPKQTHRDFVVIDDDEAFPSLSGRRKATPPTTTTTKIVADQGANRNNGMLASASTTSESRNMPAAAAIAKEPPPSSPEISVPAPPRWTYRNPPTSLHDAVSFLTDSDSFPKLK